MSDPDVQVFWPPSQHALRRRWNERFAVFFALIAVVAVPLAVWRMPGRMVDLWRDPLPVLAWVCLGAMGIGVVAAIAAMLDARRFTRGMLRLPDRVTGLEEGEILEAVCPAEPGGGGICRGTAACSRSPTGDCFCTCQPEKPRRSRHATTWATWSSTTARRHATDSWGRS